MPTIILLLLVALALLLERVGPWLLGAWHERQVLAEAPPAGAGYRIIREPDGSRGVYNDSGRWLGSFDSRAAAEKHLRQTMRIRLGAMAINEICRERGWPVVPWGDEPWLSGTAPG